MSLKEYLIKFFLWAFLNFDFLKEPMRPINLPCPHCKNRVRAVKSRPMSSLMKEITYMCQNPDCGHVCVASLEVLRTLSLSAMPDPEIRIAISQHLRQSAANQLAR
jgi:hypothetical protein